MSTEELLNRLRDDPEAPWSEWGGAAGLTARRLATMLADYDIKSGNVRLFDGTQRKGYTRGDFTDAWARYCTHEPERDHRDSTRQADDNTTGCPHHPDVTCIDCWNRQRATA